MLSTQFNNFESFYHTWNFIASACHFYGACLACACFKCILKIFSSYTRCSLRLKYSHFPLAADVVIVVAAGAAARSAAAACALLSGFGFSLARKVAGSYYPKNFTPEGNTNKGVAQQQSAAFMSDYETAWLDCTCLSVCVYGCVCGCVWYGLLCLCMKIECHKIRTIISSAAQLNAVDASQLKKKKKKNLANTLCWLFYSSWQKVDGHQGSQCPP